jgi:hypothetical protein
MSRHWRIFFLLFLLGLGRQATVAGQGLLKRLHKQNSTINPAFGIRVGEPTGLNIQIFKGFLDSNTKSKGLFDINIAREGWISSSLQQPYKTGEWRPGGIRYSVSWFHEVNHKLFSHFFYYGIGLQAGSRKYTTQGDRFTENFVWGPLFTLHGELPVRSFSIRPHGLYCKASLFAEAVYHKEFKEDFEYIRPAVGVRLNWFY